MFVYRYHCLSIACLNFGTVPVHYLSSTCPKIEHLYPAALVGVMGWDIHDIVPMAQFPYAAMVGQFGTDLGIGHGLFPTDEKFGNKIIMVPQLEEPDI